MPTCYVMVGLPALGKSTTIEKMKTDNTWIYSTDMYIDAVGEDNGITYNEAFQSFIKDATEFNDRKVKSAMKLGKDIIWDQTNLGKKKRTKIIEMMKGAGYRVEAIVLRPPQDGHISDQVEWKRRLENRPGKNIPQHVLMTMIESYTEPTLDEGFDKITTYNMWGIEL